MFMVENLNYELQHKARQRAALAAHSECAISARAFASGSRQMGVSYLPRRGRHEPQRKQVTRPSVLMEDLVRYKPAAVHFH